MKKRFLALLLMLVMVVGMLPTAALGANAYSVQAVDASDVRTVLADTLEQLAADVPEPTFGTSGGEWSILALARGGYFDNLNHDYFAGYYDRIVETVNETAAEVDQGGALDKTKLTENSRLIMALSAIGKESTQVGDWNIVEPLSSIDNVARQGINGPIYALLALDTFDYETSNAEIRQECVSFILEKQLADGGWALFGTAGDPDITSMALQALANYQDQDTVKAAVESGIECLSGMQKEDGGYASWGTVNAESCAQAIIACTTLGIDPNTDPRFVKDGNSLVDALLNFYIENENAFSHVAGGGKNGMATDQAACALVSYVRFLDGEAAFYDMSDVKPAEIDPDITAQWPNFRGSDNNMAIVDAETPKDAEHTALQWAKKLGSGWGAAPSVQIIADDSLIVMSGTTLYKLDLEDGEVTAQAEMSAKPDWGYTPPTYGQGLIFCPLAGGTVEAFNAKTLDKVWTYQSAEGKANNWQADSPITYADGRIYVGFWKSEVAEADFVCLNAETGAEEWRYSSPGGFYWAGSAAIGDYIAVGTDDGAGDSSGNSNLLVFSKRYAGGGTAEPVSRMELTGCGDQRSSLAYADDGRVYFTTKGGYLCSAAIDAETGEISDLKKASFGYQGTSTPVVYGDYVYFGIGRMGEGYFAIADKNTLEIVKKVKMLDYPQCSMLLSTAYLEEDGNLYFYSTYNARPGGISLIKVRPDDPESAVLTELYDAEGYEQYCISSILCDEDGTLYYKNDSGNVLAVGKQDVPEVTVAAYDYNAGAAGLDGASETGVIFYQTVPFAEGLTATEAVQQAAETAGVELTMQGGYVSAINGLGAEAGGGMSGWCLNYNNDDFANLGLSSLTLQSGDQLAFHYSVNPDGMTDDIGNGWYGKPIVTSLTLAGRTVQMSKRTVFDGESGEASTTYYIRGAQGTERVMEGSGTKADPFVIPVSLPNGTDLTALTAAYDTSLGEHYRTVTGLDGSQDYSDGHAVTVATLGGNTTYYTVQASLESGGGTTTPGDSIAVTFRLIGATKSSEDVDVGSGKGDSVYQNWIKTRTYELDKGSTVYDLFTEALDGAGLKYRGAEDNYVRTIYAPEGYGGYALSEFTNGPRSGWMYLLNGEHPDQGLCEQTLKNGDAVVWHYVNDYAYEVRDWFDDGDFPSQGGEDTWVDWESDVADTNPPSGGSGGGSAAADTSDRQAADAVIALIDAIGTVTKDSGGKISAARSAYAELTDAQKKLVDNYSRLTAAEKAYAALTGILPFTDVKDHWALEAVAYAYVNDLMTGVSDTGFAPNAALNRAMLVTILYRLDGEPAVKAGNAYSDVADGAWYADAVAWASENGIVTGYGDGSFGPADNITREQMAVMLYRYAAFKGYDVTAASDLKDFNDTGSISSWALESLRWANAEQLINGRTAAELVPGGNATRGEAAAILMRFCDIMVK